LTGIKKNFSLGHRFSFAIWAIICQWFMYEMQLKIAEINFQ
jgi:hypothetical protein